MRCAVFTPVVFQRSGAGARLAIAAGPARSGCLSCPCASPEPRSRERLQWEIELFGFAVSGHPLELFDNVACDSYCSVSRLGEHVGEEVVTCGLVIERRVHHQVTGEPMKFLTLADWTGMVETELFASTYRSYGLATVRYPVLEVEAKVEPFENNRGATVLCNDGTVWDLLYSDDGNVAWHDLRNPLPPLFL